MQRSKVTEVLVSNVITEVKGQERRSITIIKVSKVTKSQRSSKKLKITCKGHWKCQRSFGFKGLASRCQMRDKRFVFWDSILKNPFLHFWAQFIRSLAQALRHPDNLNITPHPRQPGTRKHIPATQICASIPWRGKLSRLRSCPPPKGTQETQGSRCFSPWVTLLPGPAHILLTLEAGGPWWHVPHQDTQQQQQLGRCCLRLTQS